MGEARKVVLRVAPDQEGMRLDQFLAAGIPDLSRRKARVLLDIGGVFVDGRRYKMAGRTMRKGEMVSATLGGALWRATNEVGQAARAKDEAIYSYDIVHEDEDIVVVDKPAGLLVAPTPESDRQNLASLLGKRTPGGPVMVIHRIDLETSGLLVFAKTTLANQVLSEKFRVHDLEREYRVVVAGVYPEQRAQLDQDIAGRKACTHVVVEERVGELATVLGCRLETGRTHQIRIHVFGVGHPVLGDRKYTFPELVFPIPPPRMALHARRLAFAHPRTSEPLDFQRELPADLDRWLVRLRRKSDWVISGGLPKPADKYPDGDGG